MSISRGYDYEPEQDSGSYLRFPKEDSTLRMRLIGEPIVFEEATNFDGKPGKKICAAWVVLYRNKDAKITECRHFKAGMKIYGEIRNLVMDDEEWGATENYDIKISKTGQKLDTKYAVVPCSKSKITAEEKQMVDDAAYDLEALYCGEKGQGGDGRPAPSDNDDPFDDED